jgi:hypothetical protein
MCPVNSIVIKFKDVSRIYNMGNHQHSKLNRARRSGKA